MTKKLFAFDTLEYAKMLEEGGIERAEVHSASLAQTIVQNIYTKDEVDKMIEATFKQFEAALKSFDKRTYAFERRMEKRTHAFERRMEERTHELDKRIDRAFFRGFTATISILGTLIVVVGAAATFSHYFI